MLSEGNLLPPLSTRNAFTLETCFGALRWIGGSDNYISQILLNWKWEGIEWQYALYTRCSLCRPIRLRSTWCRAAVFFSANAVALSQEVPTVKWMSSQPAFWTPDGITYMYPLLIPFVWHVILFIHFEWAGDSFIHVHPHLKMASWLNDWLIHSFIQYHTIHLRVHLVVDLQPPSVLTDRS
jgi:hypothetical protein